MSAPGAHGDGDTLTAHRLARARSDAVTAALLQAGLPADSVTSVWDHQFAAREPRVTLWMFARPAGDDCTGTALPGAVGPGGGRAGPGSERARAAGRRGTGEHRACPRDSPSESSPTSPPAGRRLADAPVPGAAGGRARRTRQRGRRRCEPTPSTPQHVPPSRRSSGHRSAWRPCPAGKRRRGRPCVPRRPTRTDAAHATRDRCRRQPPRPSAWLHCPRRRMPSRRPGPRPRLLAPPRRSRSQCPG